MIQQLKELINLCYKNHFNKPTAIFLPFDSASPMAKPIFKQIKPTTTSKQGQLANTANKQAEKN